MTISELILIWSYKEELALNTEITPKLYSESTNTKSLMINLK